jgi:hypothetical protein
MCCLQLSQQGNTVASLVPVDFTSNVIMATKTSRVNLPDVFREIAWTSCFFRKARRRQARQLALAMLLLNGVPASGNPQDNNYDKLRAAALGKCQTVDAGEYQTGLFFNPEGYRSYFARSLCYQQAAAMFRDIALCASVKQRRALFSSSWGYSKSNCRKLIAEGIEKDGEALDRMKSRYEEGHVQLAGFHIERNGNGRDIDIIPEFSGAGEHAYELRFELLREDPAAPAVLLDVSGFYLTGAADNIRIYVRTSDIRRRFPGFALDRRWPVRATLVYSVGTGSQNGRWSPAFIERRFPVTARTQTLIRKTRF